MFYPQYVWLIVVGSLGAFGFGWGTGANDVANAFGTSVGAKSLTLKQAVLLASIFEFAGALVLGRVSTETIAGGIADISLFKSNPVVYAYGMCCTLFMGFLWQAVASYMEWNVSSTHSIIGGIIGFALTYKGVDGVKWVVPDTTGSSFPPVKGVVPIILSWFISPILTGFASALIFWLSRTLVLRRENSYQLSFYTLPIFVLLTTWINVYFVFTKGAKKTLQLDDSWNDSTAGWIALVIATGTSILSTVIGIPLLKRRVKRHQEMMVTSTLREEEDGTLTIPPRQLEVELEQGSLPVSQSDTLVISVNAEQQIHRAKWKEFLLKGVNTDIHKVIEENTAVKQIHDNAEVFDPQTEIVYQYLQIFSAICVIFAHGAGEVGYMAGPLGSIWSIINDGKLDKKIAPPIWIILIGAFGLVVGLATYGYNVTRAVGTKLAKISPSRGFAAELATALTILIASQYGLPTSSSQCITGAIVGVGMLEGVKGVNWKLFATTFASWVSTMVVMGVGVSALFAQGIYAPHS